MLRFAARSLLITTALSLSLAAQTSVNFSLCATTDDSHFDLSLRDINVEAEHSLPSYYSSMRVNFGTPPSVLDHLLYHEMLSPADAFMAVRLSILIGKPVDEVVTVYRHHKKKGGWGEIAKSMGIKPGSKAFHELKNGGTVVLERTRHERQLIEVNVRDDNDDGDHGNGHGNGKHHDKGHGNGKGKGK
jgi:hypothetical protein